MQIYSRIRGVIVQSMVANPLQDTYGTCKCKFLLHGRLKNTQFACVFDLLLVQIIKGSLD